ncbi:hypothetical protein [Streptomyces mirabilis]|uniref:hypothetical protein n=1 Tax=Streptomyces mirabilis TaxID=68239 RepID=UPI00332B66AE
MDKMEDLLMISLATWRFAARAATAGALAVGMLTVGVASAQAAETRADPPTCEVQTGTQVPDLTPNLANPSAQDVTNAALAWLNEVCTVDSFLNNPGGTLESTLTVASDEPNQLATLTGLGRH